MPKLISSEGLEQALQAVKGDITTRIDGVEQKLPRDNAIVHTLTHTKSGTVHRLTGLTGTSGIRYCVFKATGSYSAGDTITVDGVSYNIQMSDGKTPETNMFVSGATIPVIVDSFSTKINFKSVGSVEIPIGSTLPMNIFTTNGTFTAPKTGRYKVYCIGQGGSGGSAERTTDPSTVGNVPVYCPGGNGGSGGVAIKTIQLTAGQSVPVTVGGTSSFGSYCSATMGSAGTKKTYDDGSFRMLGGTGGTATGGDLNYSGTDGSAVGGSKTPDATTISFINSYQYRAGHSTEACSNCPYINNGHSDWSSSGNYAYGRGGLGQSFAVTYSSSYRYVLNTPYNNAVVSGIRGAVVVEMIT